MATRISVLGAGSWGTALAEVLARSGHHVRLWVRNPQLAAKIRATGENPAYHPGVRLSRNMEPTANLSEALEKAEFVVLGIPSHVMRETLQASKPFLLSKVILISTAKGIEVDTMETPATIAEGVLGKKSVREGFSVLSGPSFARDVMEGVPTAVTVAAFSGETARKVQDTVHTDTFRVFTSEDVIGVEIAGALKNVIAIAAGAVDGLGFGLSARAALITRGLAEISRIGEKMGANPLTFAGLSGLGDLILTSTGDLSRNRRIGLKLGQGRTLRQALKEVHQTAEGIRTAKAAHLLAKKLNVNAPILEEIYNTIYDRKPLKQAIRDILSRAPEPERS